MAKATKEIKATEEKAEFVTRNPIARDYDVIKYIVATEKTNTLKDNNNSLVLAVDPKASKDEIKAAVQAIFGAKVSSVNTINTLPKKRRVGRYTGYNTRIKKAIVKLDSSFDLGKINDAVASEDMKASQPEEK